MWIILPGAVFTVDCAFERHVLGLKEVLSLLVDADLFTHGVCQFIIHFGCERTHKHIEVDSGFISGSSLTLLEASNGPVAKTHIQHYITATSLLLFWPRTSHKTMSLSNKCKMPKSLKSLTLSKDIVYTGRRKCCMVLMAHKTGAL